MRDAETLASWVREGARELTQAHGILDAHGVPRQLEPDDPVELSLAGRISLALTLAEKPSVGDLEERQAVQYVFDRPDDEGMGTEPDPPLWSFLAAAGILLAGVLICVLAASGV